MVIGVFVTVLLNMYNITVTVVEEVVRTAKGTCANITQYRNSFRCRPLIRQFVGDVFIDEMRGAVAMVCMPIIQTLICIIIINFSTIASRDAKNLTTAVVCILGCVVCAANGFFRCL